MPVKPFSLAANRPAPKGFQRGKNGNKAIAIRMPPELFDQVQAYAVHRRSSFAEAARELLEKGIEHAA